MTPPSWCFLHPERAIKRIIFTIVNPPTIGFRHQKKKMLR